jgi:cyclopropane fatty-acyl-phospholipid synthase-like methyltransferase
MPDVYAIINEVDATTIARVADAMEVSAADPQLRAMLATFLSDLQLTDGTRVLEVSCGTGAVCRTLAQ